MFRRPRTRSSQTPHRHDNRSLTSTNSPHGVSELRLRSLLQVRLIPSTSAVTRRRTVEPGRQRPHVAVRAQLVRVVIVVAPTTTPAGAVGFDPARASSMKRPCRVRCRAPVRLPRSCPAPACRPDDALFHDVAVDPGVEQVGGPGCGAPPGRSGWWTRPRSRFQRHAARALSPRGMSSRSGS